MNRVNEVEPLLFSFICRHELVEPAEHGLTTLHLVPEYFKEISVSLKLTAPKPPIAEFFSCDTLYLYKFEIDV